MDMEIDEVEPVDLDMELVQTGFGIPCREESFTPWEVYNEIEQFNIENGTDFLSEITNVFYTYSEDLVQQTNSSILTIPKIQYIETNDVEVQTEEADKPSHVTLDSYNCIYISHDEWNKAFKVRNSVVACGKVLFRDLFSDEEIQTSTFKGRKSEDGPTRKLDYCKLYAICRAIAWMGQQNGDDDSSSYCNSGKLDVLTPEEYALLKSKVFVGFRSELAKTLRKNQILI